MVFVFKHSVMTTNRIFFLHNNALALIHLCSVKPYTIHMHVVHTGESETMLLFLL